MMRDDIRLAYDLKGVGRAWYIAGSGLTGKPRYELAGEAISHTELLERIDAARAPADLTDLTDRLPSAETIVLMEDT